jgi:hypothetical protein
MKQGLHVNSVKNQFGILLNKSCVLKGGYIHMELTKEIIKQLKEMRMFKSDSDSNIICMLIDKYEKAYQEGFKAGQDDKYRQIFDPLYETNEEEIELSDEEIDRIIKEARLK